MARILQSIAAPPQYRTQPIAGDLPGDYSFWFDGGAGQFHTGSAHYDFADGTNAVVACPATWLWVQIRFPNGELVEIVQRRN